MEEIPPYARFVAIGMAAAAAVGLLINHFMPESQSAARLMLLCLGPMALLLGIGGSVEPKVIWSLGKYGQHLPLKYCGVALLRVLSRARAYPFRMRGNRLPVAAHPLHVDEAKGCAKCANQTGW